jgi:hypothetical protein
MYGKLKISCACLVIAATVTAAGRTLFGGENVIVPKNGPAHADGRELNKLKVFGEAYPRVFFFRAAEGLAANNKVTYERWEKTFERLMGIEGKVIDEEIIGRSSRNIDFFTRFKDRHPDQLVLLHFNGNARDPLYESERFFAGHWLYYNGAKILSDVRAEEGETEIRVDNPNLFKVNIGRYRDRNEDIGLCMLDAEGKPDWRRSEQVQLVSVDRKNKTIRVRRGCYGTKPRVFVAGKGYAAAHVTEGPWGSRNNLMWYYNYSTCCPRAKKRRSCADVLVEHLVELFGAGGLLASFDGIEFDVLKFGCGRIIRGRGADCDADGKADSGFSDGVNVYGIGVVEFCRQLRNRLGEDILILADGMSERNQRAFGILNGIESEGWPHLRDHKIVDWSGGLNRHFFWDKNGRVPVFNYINHKFNIPTGEPGVVRRAEVPFHIHRLVFAAGMFTNSAICYSFAPKNDPDGQFGVWDEFRMGKDKRLGWLGKPLGPAVRVATGEPDLLKGKGKPIGSDFLKRFGGSGVRFKEERGSVQVTAVNPKASEIRFRLSNVPCSGPDLFILVTAHGEAMRGYPPEVARLMYVGAALKDKPTRKDTRFMTWVGDKEFVSGFYFSNINSSQVDLEFVVEGSEPVWISKIRAYAHPDVIYREFEHGLVVANPSPRQYMLDLDRFFKGQIFRRLEGHPTQDTACNDGSIAKGTLHLGPKEGLFLIRISGDMSGS